MLSGYFYCLIISPDFKDPTIVSAERLHALLRRLSAVMGGTLHRSLL